LPFATIVATKLSFHFVATHAFISAVPDFSVRAVRKSFVNKTHAKSVDRGKLDCELKTSWCEKKVFQRSKNSRVKT